MRVRMFLPALIALALMTIVTVAPAAEPQTEAANAAVQYIESLQNADGGFTAFGPDSSPSASLDAAFALVAAGEDAANVRSPGGATLGDYLSAQAPPPGDAGALAKFSFGLSAMGLDGAALIDDMHQYINAGTDGYGDDVFDEVFYVFALVAADAPRAASAAYLRSIQQADGGWEFAGGFGSDSNTTAMALQALLAAGGSPGEQATRDALAYLSAVQNDDGGFGFTATDDSDPNSTALVIQALVAAGQVIDAGGPWDRGGHTPIDGLLSFRNAASGAYQYGGEDNAFATYQAVPALMLAPFPSLETRIVAGPTPRAPTVVTAAPPATPVVLPKAGDAPPKHGSEPWWPVVALAACGAAIVAGGVFVRRAR